MARATADLPVEWLILERDAGDASRLLAVPADLGSLVGSGDLAIPEEAARGALTVRCRHAVECDARVFEADLKTGELESEHLERARALRRELEAGEPAGSVDQRATDHETEYLDWIHDVAQTARAALEAASGAVAEAAEPAAPPAPVVELRPRSSRRRWSGIERSLGLAASVLLVVSLGLGRQLARTGEEERAAREAHRQQLEQLARDQQQLESSHRETVAELRKRQQESERELRRQLAEAADAASPRTLLNLPFVVLSGATRSAAEKVALGSAASHLVVIVQLEPTQLYPEYRLELRRSSPARTVWSSDGLVTDGAELTAALPRELLPAGGYTLRLSGLRAGEWHDLQEYPLRVERE